MLNYEVNVLWRAVKHYLLKQFCSIDTWAHLKAHVIFLVISSTLLILPTVHSNTNSTSC